MSDAKNLLDWFSKRKEDMIQVGSRGHLIVISGIIAEMAKSLGAMSQSNWSEAAKCIERVILAECEADRIEDRLCAEISAGDLSISEREDLLHFVKKSDTIADWIREAAFYVQMALDIKATVPDPIWKSLARMCSELEIQCKTLIKAIESLAGDRNVTLRHVDMIKDQERIIDDLHYKAAKDILLSDMDLKGVTITRSITESIEMASDTCKQCSDTISLITIVRRQ